MPLAIETIKSTLNTAPGDRDLNFKIALLLAKKDERGEITSIKHYLKRSFAARDNRYHAQFCYARILYIDNDILESAKAFRTLFSLNVDPKIKWAVQGIIKVDDIAETFKGEIVTLNVNYGFLKRDGQGDILYFNFNNLYSDNSDSSEISDYSKFRRGDRVTFSIGFNYKGPSALNIHIEK